MTTNPPRLPLLFLLFLTFIALQPVESRSIATAFFPRGGGSDSFRQRGQKRSPASKSKVLSPESEINAVAVTQSADGDLHVNDSTNVTFDRDAVTKRLHKEEVAEIKKAQLLLQKQQRRRGMDKTWLDKGITGVIEFFENLFRWEVIDV